MTPPTPLVLDVDTLIAGLNSPNHSDESRRQWCALFVRDIGLLAAAAARAALLDALDAARAENARLREALDAVTNAYEQGWITTRFQSIYDSAREALKGT